MDQITLSAYAKINLTLAICGVRADGYHTLESVMQEISLADTVTLKKIPSGIVIECDREGIPTNEKNLCWKAARRYLDAAATEGGVWIRLNKCIPDGAGMGGGSSDAAAVLKGLSTLYPAQVPMESIALSVGADVPFFLSGKTAFCAGIGEEVTPIPFPGKEKLFAVVAKNCEGLSTPEIYALYDRIAPDSPAGPKKEDVIASLEKGDRKRLYSLMQNDLELPSITKKPEIAHLKNTLLEEGAEAAMMTGSGSAVFGLFTDERKARKCAETCKKIGAEAYFCTLL